MDKGVLMKTTLTNTSPKTMCQWLSEQNGPLIIAGPCSAESEIQVLETARQLSKIPQIRVFRAGVWKPRTRPNGFEGVGIKGLAWLQKVKAETGLDTAVEVANTDHVDQALSHGIEVLWIGARTSTNPFSVQEIATALHGVDIPVLVKNPIHPDINSWIGAIERISQAGIKKLVAIHRGFSTNENTPYRNAPKWDIAVEFKRLMPEIPLIADPSHIGGNRDIIAQISQTALDLAMQGLMVECHIDPDNALSDAFQQITPYVFAEIINNLKFRKPEGNGLNGEHLLEMLRSEIDLADTAILEALGRRMEIAAKIGQYKRHHNMTILQVNRWSALLDDRLKRANILGLNAEVVKDIFQILHNRAIEIQEKILNKTNGK